MKAVVYPPGRFGAVELNGEKIVQFNEKPMGDGSLINGDYFQYYTCYLKLESLSDV